MFGRILIPVGEETVLAIPREAVQEVGQLTLVEVLEDGRASRRAIRVGRTWGSGPDVPAELRGCVEVLSGLSEGEQVLLPAKLRRRVRETHQLNANIGASHAPYDSL